MDRQKLKSLRIGVALIVVGALLLLVSYLTGMESNLELLTGLVLIVAGLVWDVWRLKHGSKY